MRASNNADSIILDAPAPARRAFAVPYFVGISIAQGGRQIAVRAQTGAQLDSTIVLSHTGAQLGSHIDQWRSFLERDTLVERWRITFPPGGNVDTFGRVLFPYVEKELGQQLVVDNRGGANGILGSDIVAKAAPDGYTLMTTSFGFAVNPAISRTRHSLVASMSFSSVANGLRR